MKKRTVQVQLYIFFWAIVIVSMNIAAIDDSQLLSLLNTNQPAAKTSAATPGMKPSLLQLLSVPKPTKATTPEKKLSLLTLLSTAKPADKKTPKKVSPGNDLDFLLQVVMSQQSNPLYQKAMKILQEEKLRRAYDEDMLSIHLFFLDYSSKVLQKYFVQTPARKPSSLTDLLQLVQSSTTPTVPSPFSKESTISLLDLITMQAPVVKSKSGTAVKHATSPLIDLLMDQDLVKATPALIVKSTPLRSQGNNLLSLLSPGT